MSAVVYGGALRRLYVDYKDKAEFIIVYIKEAHTTEGWKMGPKFSDSKQTTTLEERIDRARKLLEIVPNAVTSDPYDASKIRVLVDDMNDTFDNAFWSWPDRAIVIQDGRLVFTGRNIAQQLRSPDKPLTHDLREWMDAHYK
ncbi:type I iodothyronine deiodinase-like [Saccoglossus kowalevskii]|uniref:Iodothyronine deiodinase n=1 Tax=Saccoglossus kowalevskii TaxID=10224 RepID=A0ABM0MZA1_SACKO|nr:PREDICTED: type I iodothyronine deiodinase-like [Saccoglossus kowalevskii]